MLPNRHTVMESKKRGKRSENKIEYKLKKRTKNKYGKVNKENKESSTEKTENKLTNGKQRGKN